MKFIITFLLISTMTSCDDKPIDLIVYNFPDSVELKLKKYIEKNEIDKQEFEFAAYLFVDDKNRYVVTILNFDRKNIPKNLDLIINNVIDKSNRKLKLNDNLLPLFTPEDIAFVNFGEEKMRNGRIAQKRIILNLDGYTIIFDKSGNIYQSD